MPTTTKIIGRIFAVLVLLLFVVTSWMSANDDPALRNWSVGTTVALTIVLLGWFLFAFTGKDEDKSESMFIFAYVFTFISLALLILPPMGDSVDRKHSGKKHIRSRCWDQGGIQKLLIPIQHSRHLKRCRAILQLKEMN